MFAPSTWAVRIPYGTDVLAEVPPTNTDTSSTLLQGNVVLGEGYITDRAIYTQQAEKVALKVI